MVLFSPASIGGSVDEHGSSVGGSFSITELPSGTCCLVKKFFSDELSLYVK